MEKIVCVVQLLNYPDYDPVDCGLNILARDFQLGLTGPNDPFFVCVQRG